MGAVTIATSIMPRRIEAQQAAIGSWLGLGFAVVAVNPPGEVEHLHASFPGVQFVQASACGGPGEDVPHVFLPELFRVLNAQPGAVCGVVNSDICLSAPPEFNGFLARHTEGAMVFGSRIDVEPGDPGVKTDNPFGFDFFFFQKGIIDTLPLANFYLGMPWWDFWLPLAAASRGILLKRLLTPIACHVVHDVAWSEADLERFWRILSQHLSDASPGSGGDATNVSRLTDALAMDMARGGEILRLHLQYGADSIFLPSAVDVPGTVTINEATFLAMKEKLIAFDARSAENERSMAAVLASRSWRITEPLRMLKGKLQSLLGSKSYNAMNSPGEQ